METKEAGFIDFFKEIPNHRGNRDKLHRVEEILLIVFCGMAAGCDSWNDLELFGKTKPDYLRKYFLIKMERQVMIHCDVFFRALNPKAFESCFIKWVGSFQMELSDKVVAIDGKTSRRSFDGDNKPMHLVSAFASEFGITLGQLKTAEKSNEISAISELIELLDITGSIVTIDAMGCRLKLLNRLLALV